MKKMIAISSKGKTLKSFLDIRFGRCESIVLYDAIKKDHAIIDNPFKDGEKAGVSLVAFLEKHGVTTIVTGEVGPKVQDVLKEHKMQLVLMEEERIKIEDILTKIK